MAPVRRERMSEISVSERNPRSSAVLILLYPSQDSFRTVLIERPVYEGVHSGQVAFPGGKFEPEDLTLENTALREAEEEVGIARENVAVLGRLTDLYISPSNFLVSPIIAYTDQIPVFKPDPREVNKVITIGLDMLNDISIRGVKTITYSGGYKIKTPYYEVEGLTVWGATAMIISELNAVIADVNAIF
jgi:8-oxo-dGTP pyrophosphatase MutT (NUDIX family)